MLRCLCRYCGLFIALILLTVSAQSQPILQVTTLPDYAPFCYLYEGTGYGVEETLAPDQRSQVLRGFSWDVVRESLHAQGYHLRLTVQPWARAFRQASSEPGIAIFPVSRTEERLAYLSYSSYPVNRASYLVYVPRSSDIDWQGWGSFNGKRLAVMRGYNYGVEWQEWPEIELMEVDSMVQGFELILLGRVSGFAGYEVTWDHHLRQRPHLIDKVRKLPAYATNEEYLAIRSDTPNVERILQAFDRGYEQLQASGRLATLKIRYGLPD
ncbi:hypothetical protein CHH28_12840 [Bacterioplanes sanyensis]|uniref:Solute-binding protein family 3/N-terminal domain-containing protein n=1 Tax=Bacterioplanes sanyensis TaxID=1249553 RepID=A0A222FLW1_9GAMM|nr:transporter substrate-binding domain-containing protein [Bacterioplanes sanyensis]ASP39504.1 hypothetical protein CHH28_12840 [Bacterioplanes sanyensis]